MAWWVRVPAVSLEDLSSIPGTMPGKDAVQTLIQLVLGSVVVVDSELLISEDHASGDRKVNVHVSMYVSF